MLELDEPAWQNDTPPGGLCVEILPALDQRDDELPTWQDVSLNKHVPVPHGAECNTELSVRSNPLQMVEIFTCPLHVVSLCMVTFSSTTYRTYHSWDPKINDPIYDFIPRWG